MDSYGSVREPTTEVVFSDFKVGISEKKVRTLKMQDMNVLFKLYLKICFNNK